MNTRIVKDRYFEVSEDGLHLLRNGYNHKTYPLGSIEFVQIKRGKSISNWGMLFVFGIFLIGAAIYLGAEIVNFFTSDSSEKMSIYVVILPILLPVFGGYCLYLSLKMEEVISFKIGKEERRFATKPLRSSGQLDTLLDFLREKNIRVKD